MDVSGIGLSAIFNTHGTNGSSPSGNLDEATQRLIEDKDKDGNGTLSAVEISISAEAFQLADANDDGELDADELKNSADMIGEELREEDAASEHRSILDFFRSGPDDATETTLNQTA